MSNISFITLQKVCSYQGYIKEGCKMCGFKNGEIAKQWEDWQECKASNCYLITKKLKADNNENQIALNI